MNPILQFPQKSYVGKGTITHLRNELLKYAPNRILIITDQTLVKLGLIAKVIGELQDGLNFDIYTDVSTEPTVTDANSLVNFMRTEQFELVIGIGGGSVLDLAKLAAVLTDNEGNVKEYLNLTATKKIAKKGLPKFLLPTTSGTGSEVTDIAVFSLGATKDVVNHPYLLADLVIVDPELTRSVPPRVTAATGVDALTHAIEAYISVNSNHITDSLAEKAIQLIGESLVTVVKDGDNRDGREKMSIASYMAGMSFYNAGVAGVHALAYPLGSKFNIPHGESNAVMLPYVLNYIKDSCTTKLNIVFNLISNQDTLMNNNEEGSERCINYLKDLVLELNLPSTLKEYGIQKSDLDELTDKALQQSRLLARSPKTLKKEDIYLIYESALVGKML